MRLRCKKWRYGHEGKKRSEGTVHAAINKRCSLVIDCSRIPFVDYMGLFTLKKVRMLMLPRCKYFSLVHAEISHYLLNILFLMSGSIGTFKTFSFRIPSQVFIDQEAGGVHVSFVVYQGWVTVTNTDTVQVRLYYK